VGEKLTRKKPKVFLESFLYRMLKMVPMSKKRKIKFYLDMEWIFDRLAHEMSFKIYQPDKHPFRIYTRQTMLKHIDGTQTVLDLGCNLGDLSYMLSEKAKEVVGIDYMEKAIETAKQRWSRPNLTFVHAEALDYLKKNTKKFDVLILSHILEHLDDPKTFLLNFKDFFKTIYIELPDFDRYYLNHYRKYVGNKLIYSDNDHITEFDRHELKQLLKECNLEIFEEEYIFGVQKLWCRVIN
jgi:SAM-dependent methyltransferase